MPENQKKRILSLDVGEIRTGVAISDPMGFTSRSLGFISGESKKEKIAKIVELIEKHSPEKIVVGIPINMNGTKGSAAEKVLKFVQQLRKEIKIPIETIDERLSSAEAERLLITADVSRSKRKKVIDGMSAVLILQTYLERRSANENT